MFVHTVCEIGFGDTIPVDLGPAERRELYDRAVRFLEDGKYLHAIDGDAETGVERVRFLVFNICVTDCMKLATLTLQHTFRFLDLSAGAAWFRYATNERSRQRLRANLRAMSLGQFLKRVHDNSYVLFFRRAEAPLEGVDAGLASLEQRLLPRQAAIETRWLAHGGDTEKARAELLRSLDERRTASSRYFARCMLWRDVFAGIDL